MKKLLLFIALASWCSAATYYVDASVGSSGSGASGSPFKDISDVPGLSAGDIVKFSCGSTGQTRTYNIPASPGYWNPGNGSAGNPIIVKVWDDDSAHGTGTAIFETSNYQILSGPSYITFSGKYLTDGLMHFKTGTSFQTREEFSNINHFHVEYLDGSGGSLGFGSFASLVGCEVNNCSINNIDLLGNTYDHGVRFLGCAGAGGSTYADAMNFHHNTISVYRLITAFGNDGISCTGVGYSIHHNTITGVYNASFATNSQHQDGMQDTGGSSNIQVYDNEIVNICNYGIFMEAYNGGFTNLYIWNNLLRLTDNAMNSGTPAGIVVGINGGNASFPIIMTNIIVGNNLIVDYNTGNAVCASVDNNPNLSVTWTNTALYNNIGVNGTTSVSTTNNPTCVNSGNVFMTSSQAGTGGSKGFVAYTAFDNNNNYRVNSTSSPQYHAGAVGALTYYTADILGNTYNALAPSSGPYEFISGGTPVRLSSTVNSAGTTVTLALDQSCTTGAGGNGGYTISPSGGACTLTYSSGSGSSSYVFTTSRTINSGETITDSYTQPGNGIEATTGGADLASFSTQTVTNNSTQGGGSTNSSVISGKVVLSGKVQIK